MKQHPIRLVPTSQFEALLEGIVINVEDPKLAVRADDPEWKHVVLNGNITVLDRIEVCLLATFLRPIELEELTVCFLRNRRRMELFISWTEQSTVTEEQVNVLCIHTCLYFILLMIMSNFSKKVAKGLIRTGVQGINFASQTRCFGPHSSFLDCLKIFFAGSEPPVPSRYCSSRSVRIRESIIAAMRSRTLFS